jgi:phosphatidylglycerophosphate synthase
MITNGRPSYQSSVKSEGSDELINTYLLRPIAHLFVRVIYPTSITPNQVTVASIVAGCFAAATYAFGGTPYAPLAGLLITLKDLLDSADGQLARAKQLYSRYGRFLDSVGDFVVNLLVFGAISILLYRESGWSPVFLLGCVGFVGISLRVSYHVFYQTSYLHLRDVYVVNRVTEEIGQEDLAGDPRTLRMQRLFLFLYGWQDRLMVRIDTWSLNGPAGECREAWYGDRMALRLSGFLGPGTELFVLMICSVVRRLDVYLLVSVVAMNVVWGACIVYRRFFLAKRTKPGF